MSDEGKTKKDAVFQLLNDAEAVHTQTQIQARELVRMTQSGLDRARITQALLRVGSVAVSTLDNLEIVWRREIDASRLASHSLRETNQVLRVAVNSTSYATTTAAVDMGGFTLPSEPEATRVARRINAMLSQEALLRKVCEEMQRCGLDLTRGEKRSAMAHVEDAERALSSPSGPDTSPAAALVTLRSGIEETIREVLGRSAGQERAKGWEAKVASVGRRSACEHVRSDHFHHLAKSIVKLIDRLSGAKDRSMTRDEVQLLYYDGLQFLLTFLEGVDERRLRP